MDAMFTIFPILFGLVFFVVLIGMVVHMVMFGTIFGMAVKRFAEESERRRNELVAQSPKTCTYCGGTIPAGVVPCPSCGATP